MSDETLFEKSVRLLQEYFAAHETLTFDQAIEYANTLPVLCIPGEIGYEDIVLGFRDRGLIEIDFDRREYHRLPAKV